MVIDISDGKENEKQVNGHISDDDDDGKKQEAISKRIEEKNSNRHILQVDVHAY